MDVRWARKLEVSDISEEVALALDTERVRAKRMGTAYAGLGLLVAVAIAGCGSSHASSKQAAPLHVAPASDRATFIAEAEDICRKLSAEIAPGRSKAPTVAEITRYVPKNIELERAALVELSHLMPPPSMRSDWQQMNRYRHVLVDDLIRLEHAAKQRNLASLTRVASEKIHEHKILRVLGDREGFRYCGLV